LDLVAKPKSTTKLVELFAFKANENAKPAKEEKGICWICSSKKGESNEKTLYVKLILKESSSLIAIRQK